MFAGRKRVREQVQPRGGQPHRNLMAAVLRAAFEDVSDAASRANAIAYIESRDRGWSFSFENLCEALDMNPGQIRRQLNVE